MQTRDYVQIVLVPLFGLIATLAIGFTALLWQGRSLEDRLQNVENRVYTQGEHLQGLDRRVHAVEDRMQAVEDRMQAVENRMQAVENRMQAIETDMGIIKAQLIELNAALARLLGQSDRQAEREPAAPGREEPAP